MCSGTKINAELLQSEYNGEKYIKQRKNAKFMNIKHILTLLNRVYVAPKNTSSKMNMNTENFFRVKVTQKLSHAVPILIHIR